MKNEWISPQRNTSTGIHRFVTFIISLREPFQLYLKWLERRTELNAIYLPGNTCMNSPESVFGKILPGWVTVLPVYGARLFIWTHPIPVTAEDMT